MAHGDFKDLTRRTASEKILYDKAFNIAKHPRSHEYQRGLVSMVYKFFDKRYSATRAKKCAGGAAESENMAKQELAEELHKPVIRKFEKQKVHSSFIDNIWGDDLGDMQLLSKFNQGTRVLLCFIDIFNKYDWVIPLKDKKDFTITNAFQKILDESNCKLNEIWIDKDREFIIDQWNHG